MFTASEKRKSNIAEYLLYMWQIEDLIRANNLDMESIRHNIIDKYTSLTPSQLKNLGDWYESLIDMMRQEGIEKTGHLQINRNILNSMVDLHSRILAEPRFAGYSSDFYRVLPLIVELRSKAGNTKSGEIESCFNALYGILMLRLSGKKISTETTKAMHQISSFLSRLAHYYNLDEQDKLFNPDNYKQ